MQLINIQTNTTSSEDRNVIYNIAVDGNIIYTGKAFIRANTNTATIDVESIVRTLYYRGERSIKPMLNNNKYVTEAFAGATDSFYFVDEVRIYGADIQTQQKQIKFYPDYELDGLKSIESIVPEVMPEGFKYKWAYYSSIDDSIQIESNGQTRSNAVHKGLNFFVLTGNSNLIEGGNRYPIVSRQGCMNKFYLVWLDHNATMVCRPFTDKSEVSFEYKQNNRVDLHNAEWIANTSETKKWKLKSFNLSDMEYRAYEEIFKSPYLVLLDTDLGKMEYVIPTQNSIKRKTHKDESKPIYFEIEVEACEKQMI